MVIVTIFIRYHLVLSFPTIYLIEVVGRSMWFVGLGCNNMNDSLNDKRTNVIISKIDDISERRFIHLLISVLFIYAFVNQ